MNKDRAEDGIRARIALKRLGRPHRCGYSHKRNAGDAAEYAEQQEFKHVLIGDGKPIKVATMTIAKAWGRNCSLRGTGFSWARVDNSYQLPR